MCALETTIVPEPRGTIFPFMPSVLNLTPPLNTVTEPAPKVMPPSAR